MNSAPSLLSFLLMMVSGWVYRHQLIVIEFLQAENRLHKAKLGPKRIRFTDAERTLLARKAKAVGRRALLKLDTVVSPDTLMRWHRRLVAQKWNFAHRRSPGRPGIMREISALIVRMAQDNSGWGYTRIQGALANLGHKVGRGTVANVLEREGIEPARLICRTVRDQFRGEFNRSLPNCDISSDRSLRGCESFDRPPIV